jgi:hypothetical protein
MRTAVFLSLFLFFTACTNPERVPADVISKDSMQNILWDIFQADQFSTQYLVRDSAKLNVKTETMKLYEEVFRIHHISRAEFEKSYRFYLEHPNIASVMFDSLSAMAIRLRTQAYSRPPVKYPTGKDSLKLHRPELLPPPKKKDQKYAQ